MNRLSQAFGATALFISFSAMTETPASEPTDHSHVNPSNQSAAAPKPKEHDHGGKDAGSMRGMYGAYPMTRDASGTSWVPDSSYVDGIHFTAADWSVMTHGFLNAIYDHQGGARGDNKTFSTSMLMLMGQRSVGSDTIGLRAMISLDPLMGKSGYPLLLQTGETADGQTPLLDRQHPHDLFMELSVAYGHTLSSESSVFGYIGLPGEPALGPPSFMHRLSSIDNPEAPISHHWFDSTHITFGVMTAGYVYRTMKLEGSVFRGREPDQYRYNIEAGSLDSTSVRLSYNPTPNWSLQTSFGHIHSPEKLEPDKNIDRTTASAIYNKSFNSNNWQTTFAWSRNSPNHGETTDAYFVESALNFKNKHTTFTRFERVDKNELFAPGDPRDHDVFLVNKLSVGYVHDFPTGKHVRFGVGGLVGIYSLPSELDSAYGDPRSYMLFARLKLR